MTCFFHNEAKVIFGGFEVTELHYIGEVENIKCANT